MLKRLAVVMTMIGTVACGSGDTPNTSTSAPTAAPAAERTYLLERVDDAAVVQMYADGFAALALKEKTVGRHLYHAALAGPGLYLRPTPAPTLEDRAAAQDIRR